MMILKREFLAHVLLPRLVLPTREMSQRLAPVAHQLLDSAILGNAMNVMQTAPPKDILQSSW